jgi:hypothetical protein
LSLESPIYRKYDHRLRNLIATSKDPYLLPHIKIPLSTRRSWVRKGPVEVITMSEFDLNTQELLHKVASLEKRLLMSQAESTLTSKSIKIMGFELQYKRTPKSVVKESNAFIPFEMLGGATPLEVYSGMADNKFSTQLTANVAQARITRMTFNRSQNCGRCPA